MTGNSTRLVCFDLGGVLARIRRTWNACAEATGVQIGLRENEIYDLTDFALFDGFQLGSFETSHYVEELSRYLSVSKADAIRVHNAILDKPYAGTHRLVRDLEEAGHRRACLSNTNALHWAILNSPAFGAINELDFKMVSQEVRLLKPEPAIFQLFDAQAETSPEHVVYFDDHEGNVLAARNHGWNAVLIDHEGDTAAQMRGALKAHGVGL